MEEEDQVEEMYREELKKGLQRITLGKASGSDGIDPEMIKWFGEKGRKCQLMENTVEQLKDSNLMRGELNSYT